jgi:hypothetical protein
MEIRLQIWELALFSTPRVVEFIEVLNIDPPAPYNPRQPRLFDHLLLSKKIPLSLQICHETRSLALSRYIFSTGKIKLYLDPQIDTLYFGKLASYSTLQIFALCSLESDLRRLERLVIKEKFLHVLGRSVRTDTGPKSYVGLAFKLLSGLEDLILILPRKTAHGQSTLGPLCYDQHCAICSKMKEWEGLDGWLFPTYQQFVRAERNGVENEISDDAYRSVLEMPQRAMNDWFREFVKRRMWRECRVAVDVGTGNIKACSVTGLHRLVNAKTK